MRAEFHGERIVEMHMQRLGGKEQLLAQVYSAFATRRDDTVELALRAYGAPARYPAKTCLQACQCAQRGLRLWFDGGTAVVQQAFGVWGASESLWLLPSWAQGVGKL